MSFPEVLSGSSFEGLKSRSIEHGFWWRARSGDLRDEPGCARGTAEGGCPPKETLKLTKNFRLQFIGREVPATFLAQRSCKRGTAGEGNAKDPKAFPVILFSPGAFGTTFQYSSIIEDLVSHGYIVAAIEHTSEVFAVVFPDGRVHVYSETRIPKESIPPPGSTKEEYEAKLEAWYRHNVDVRAADISFVLDKLTELNRNISSACGPISSVISDLRFGSIQSNAAKVGATHV